MEHILIVKVGGCTSEQAEEVMRERLGYDESYGFDYTLEWEWPPLPPASESPERARDVALSINTVRSASFTRRSNGQLTGVAYDSSTGIEFDVIHRSHGWYVSDDHGRQHRGDDLQSALQRAIEANTPGGTTT